MSEDENETVIILRDEHVQPTAAHPHHTHPHHKKDVICKAGTQSITLGPSIYHPREETYVRTDETRDGLAVFRKVPG